MNNFPRYENYKDSGVDWLGDVPSHWKVISFKNILTERNEKNDPIKSREILSLSIDKGVTLYAEKTTNLDRFKEDFTQYKVAHKGDLVFNSMNMIVGAVGVSNYFGCVSPVYYTYYESLNNSKRTKFYEYLFRSRIVQGVLYSLGRGIMAIDRGEGRYNTVRLKVSRDDLRSLKLPFPSISEQTSIAEFLDRKTAQIDQAIKQKERQIKLLQEHRQILVNNAVTRGINSSVKMKDTGIEWLGEIPEHWKTKRLKYVVKIIKRIAGKLGYDILSITQKGIKIKDIESGEGQLSMDYSKYQLVYKGDFAMNHMDLLTGYVDISKYDGVISPDYRVFVLTETNCEQDYLLSLFQIGYLNKIFYAYGQGVSLLGRWRFPTENFNNFVIPIPPKSEQIAISKYIVMISDKIETAISCKQKEIEKLKEYKAVLINSAVTGKIKVSDNN